MPAPKDQIKREQWLIKKYRNPKGIKPKSWEKARLRSPIQKGHPDLVPQEARKRAGIKISKLLKGKHFSSATEFKKGHKGIGNVFQKGHFLFRGKNHWNWKGGKSFELYTIDWNRTLKRAIRERDNYICRLCSQYGNVVHHIDYDKKNCDPKNLITLCHRCHMKTNHHRDYWIKLFLFYDR